MARPIITTDFPGCRDTVEHGLTGYICRARDANDLATKMEAFLALPVEGRTEMGKQARIKMEREFDEQFVINRYLAIVTNLTASA